MESNRHFLHFFNREEYEIAVPKSDEKKNKPFPLFQKPYDEKKPLIDLIPHEEFTIGKKPFIITINRRMSRRNYTDESLTLEELSFLLWCTQGVKRTFKDSAGVLRTVPSAGAKSPFEAYLIINRVEGVEPGLYRYISFKHKLLHIKRIENAENLIGELTYDQMFVGKGAVIFCWVAIPYRTEWRYTILSHKFIAIDLGHVSENLYLACEAIDLATVAIGYYEQKKFDNLLELDGKNEFVVLVSPVGKTPIL
ncbi:MAG: SagB/ThcOx family dehydrogenase [Promethearchaeota archaeon]